MTEQRTVTITLDPKARINVVASKDTTEIRAFIPELGIIKWSAPMFVPNEVALSMLPGESYPVNVQQSPPNANGKQFWNWVGYASPSETAASAAQPPAPEQQATVAPAQEQPVQGAPPPVYQTMDARDRLIVRQVAFKGAIENTQVGTDVATIAELTDVYYNIITQQGEPDIIAGLIPDDEPEEEAI
jgi:hypothetical protein